jgi:pimeloyl-ACP methyl ester carboxylesterase/DNA-binding SARP family transcriptional activator
MLCLLGPPAIWDGNRLEPLRLRPKALAILARLAVNGEPLTRADLAALVFPEAEDPRGALRWHLSYLRAHLPDQLRAGLELTPARLRWTGPTDLALFRREAPRLLATPPPPDATTTLGRYRGDLCTGLTVSASPEFDNWLYVEQEALRQTFRQAVVAFASATLATGAPRAATEPLARLISLDPYFEAGHLLLIQAYEALALDQAAASAYQRYQRIVRQELQAEPVAVLARRYEPEPPDGPTLPIDDFVQLREITLHTVEWPGDEPAIVAIHGSTMSAYALTVLAERLAPDLRVIALDLRGHGFSDKPPGCYHLERHAADVRELIAALGLRQPVLLGFSLGGAVAALVAADGAPLAGLILLDGVIGDRAFTSNAAAKMLPTYGAILGPRFGGFAEYVAQWRSHQPRRSDEAERLLERTVRYDLAPLPDGTYRRRGLRQALEATWASLAEVDTLAALARVRCPVLIAQAALPWIGGEPYLSDAIIAAQFQAVPHAHHFLARSCDHQALARDPEPALVTAIKEFVLGPRTAPARLAARVAPNHR